MSPLAATRTSRTPRDTSSVAPASAMYPFAIPPTPRRMPGLRRKAVLAAGSRTTSRNATSARRRFTSSGGGKRGGRVPPNRHRSPSAAQVTSKLPEVRNDTCAAPFKSSRTSPGTRTGFTPAFRFTSETGLSGFHSEKRPASRSIAPNASRIRSSSISSGQPRAVTVTIVAIMGRARSSTMSLHGAPPAFTVSGAGATAAAIASSVRPMPEVTGTSGRRGGAGSPPAQAPFARHMPRNGRRWLRR